ncbi:predicted protein [Postia placenta Mad-698-R]|uniref:Uncharacterized protein n=1 Tax=Postia placenta MAD-698-R-SB12 TaxID=670580 RepID=A0A1X6N462_9APHY|nr:hypothetical protein POSPLADRAFT_1045622 [Postia placenta MAD-698-R-SB12]EED85844.1 predicted protein [Postia placenta Mad-698-R]OSX63232.1 hypothetical protein POSPLADRAFT_1045622 [Postia placenta MAD-698-R-SB12]
MWRECVANEYISSHNNSERHTSDSEEDGSRRGLSEMRQNVAVIVKAEQAPARVRVGARRHDARLCRLSTATKSRRSLHSSGVTISLRVARFGVFPHTVDNIMSLAQSAKRGVRIIALPLATSAAPAHKASHHLTYYHFVTPPPHESNAQSWSSLITTKAARLWAELGNAPEGNWKRRAFLYGERFIDRIDFEELALKSFDTSLGPKLLPVGHTDKFDANGHPTIPLIYPPSACTSPLAHLHALLEKRTPRHRNGCLIWTAISPLTAPLKLIRAFPVSFRL